MKECRSLQPNKQSHASSHDSTAALELLEQPREELLDDLLDLVALLLLLLLAMVRLRLLLLGLAAVLLTTVVAPAAMISALVPARLGRKRRRRVDLAAAQVDVYPALVLLGGVVEAHLPAHLLDAR